jgi:photosystem II stability/assembly factor-like uncharacterized protein
MFAAVTLGALVGIGPSSWNIASAQTGQRTPTTRPVLTTPTGFNASIGSISAVSCVAQRCLAVGGTDGAQLESTLLQLVVPSTDWVDEAPPAGSSAQLGDVSCLSESTCVEVGEGTNDAVIRVTRDGGRAWSDARILRNILDLNAVSCAAPSTCVAVGQLDSSFSGVILSTTDAGRRWRERLLSADSPTFTDVSCATVDDCVVVGNRSPLYSADYYQGLSYRTSNAGGSWAPSVIAPSGDYMQGISCATALTCVAVATSTDAHGRNVALSFRSEDGGRTFQASRAVAEAASLADVDCLTATACYAVGSDQGAAKLPDKGIFLWSSDSGRSWTVSNLPGEAADPLGISCSAATEYEVVGAGPGSNPVLSREYSSTTTGVALLTSNQGSTWIGQRLPFGLDDTSGLACIDARRCVAVATDLSTGRVALLRTGDGGRSWSTHLAPAAVQAINDITCTSLGTCVAVGASVLRGEWNYVTLVSRDAGSRWSLRSGRSAPFGMTEVTCPSRGTCFATEDEGDPKIMRSDDLGARWIRVGTIANGTLSGFDCTSSKVCWAYFNAESFRGMERTSDGGRTWGYVDLPSNVSYMQTFRCLTPTWCAAVIETIGSVRQLIVTDDGGSTWRELRVLRAADAIVNAWCVRPFVCSAWVARQDGSVFLASSDGLATWHSVAPFNRAEMEYISLGAYEFAYMDCPVQRECVIAGTGLSLGGGALFTMVAT